MKEITNEEIVERVEKAVSIFKEGYNCAQAVYMAYSDCFGIEKEQAAIIAGAFGGGMGRMREVCGAVSGMCLIAGQAIPLVEPASTPKTKQEKANNYALFQEMAKEFKGECGSIICRELLGVDGAQVPQPEDRTEKYYKKRPCVEMVRLAAQIAGKKLIELAERNAE